MFNFSKSFNEAYILNLGLKRSLEPCKKFSVGGGWLVGGGGGGGGFTVSLVFCFGLKL